MIPRPEHSAASPVASVIVPAYDCADLIDATLDSLLRQTCRDIEIIVIDDASQDGTAACVAAVAARDARVRLLHSPENRGPGAARNRGLEIARGTWVAFVDSDDLIDPARMERLIAAAEKDGADIACDNVELFEDGKGAERRRVLDGRWARGQMAIDLRTFVLRNHMELGANALGYLQPIVRRDMLERSRVRFDERLRVGEDYDFVARLLAADARMMVYPWATYFYRQRAGSLSRQASLQASRTTMRGFLDADAAFRAHPAAAAPKTRRALDARRRSIENMQALLDLRDAWSVGQRRRALRMVVAQPGVLTLVAARLLRRLLY